MFEAVERLGGRGIVAIDGRCCSGKTSLAELLAERFDGAVFHMDDFFLRPEQRTEARLAAPGGNVDYERFLEDVLIPVKAGLEVRLRRYDCALGELMPEERRPFRLLTIIEGSYSLHHELRGYIDLAIALTCGADTQLARVKARELTRAGEFVRRWIPLEELYLERCGVFELADIVIDTSGLF